MYWPDTLVLVSTEAENVNREASERFAAGYIQCMHEVHTFVSNCPGIDATIAADLLNHLLECMPLNDEDCFQDLLSDLMSDSPNNYSTSSSEAMLSPGGRSGSSGSTSALSPSPSTTSDDLSSDLDETDSEQSHISTDVEHQDNSSTATMFYSKSMWRPW